MSKRVANKQLTLENFEEEEREDDYDSSGPQIASNEVLKSRTLAKAKRRSDLNMSSNDSIDDKKTAFSGFKGFGSNPVSNTISSSNPFQSLSQMTSNTSSQSTPLSLNKPLFSMNGNKNQNKVEVKESLVSDKDETYNNKLSELNKCFMTHVKSYMDKSSYYDFTQVCKEYIEYQNKIESELNEKKEIKTVFNERKDEKSVIIENKLPSIENKSISSTPNDSQNSSQFGFQSQSTIGGSTSTPSPISSQASANILSQSFSNETMFAKPTNQFSFGVNKFNTNFNNSSFTPFEPQNVETVDNNDDDNEEPPKVESVIHQESDSVLSKRCKLFYKKVDKFVEKGLGHLFIKKEENASNAQLLIRADTKLGNVLLNISLVESLPVIKANNNKGVLLTCVPNPPLDPKASSDTQTSVTFLIRVKTAEDCDQLYDNLVKYKSA